MNSKGPNTDTCGTPPLTFPTTNLGNIKPQILFNNEDVEFVVKHKHLGVTFSSNCKWHCHIQNILKNLEKIYFTYIRVISLIYNMNSKGPNTDTCGTPPLTFPTSERQFCRITFDFCHLSNFQTNGQLSYV
jgi:hypothetical protein